LDLLVGEYVSKEPEVVRWTVEGLVINLSDVLQGELAGKWAMGISPAQDDAQAAPTDVQPAQPALKQDGGDKVARPTNVTASSTQKAGPGYTFVPSNLTDGDLASSWQPASGKSPTWFRLDYDGEITVTSIAIANGFQTTDKHGDEFLLNSRISTGRVRFSDDSEIKIEFEQDARTFVKFEVPQKRTRSVTVFVDDVFQGTKWKDLAVSEIEVRALK